MKAREDSANVNLRVIINSSSKVSINKAWCKDCGICREFCPRSVFSVNSKGRIVVENPESCTLCGICQLRCPDFAITLKEKDKDE